MERTSEFTPDHRMIITHSKRLKTVTNLITGETELVKDGKKINSWPNVTISVFEQIQADVAKSAKKLNEFKVPTK